MKAVPFREKLKLYFGLKILLRTFGRTEGFVMGSHLQRNAKGPKPVGKENHLGKKTCEDGAKLVACQNNIKNNHFEPLLRH